MNTIEFINQFLELEEKIASVTDLSRDNVDLLIDRLRIMGDISEKKACFEALKETYPEFAFWLGVNIEDCIPDCINILQSNPFLLNNCNLRTFNAIYENKWLLEFVVNNIELFAKLPDKLINEIVELTIKMENYAWLYRLLNNNDLNIRGKIIEYLISYYSDIFFKYYNGSIAGYLCEKDNEGNIVNLVDEEIASGIAYAILESNLEFKHFEEVKSFILCNYKKNNLALLLDNYGLGDSRYSSILIKDIDELFKTSKNYKFMIYSNYGEHLDSELYKNFAKLIKPFEEKDLLMVNHLFNVGLGDNLLEVIQKYMTIATGANYAINARKGSCTITFKVGDYAIKLSQRKYINTKCPDSFLIAKNYEEYFSRGEDGEINGAIEVQKYFTRPFTLEDSESEQIKEYQEKFLAEFEKDGYCVDDNPFAHTAEPNLFYLESYKDADCEDPEQLPDWFKKTPLVLVDRDYVYKKVK